MALRLMEMVIPEQEEAAANAILEKNAVERVWKNCGVENTLFVKWLLRAEEVEAVTDELSARFGSYNRFHLVILNVEAALPRPEGKKAPEPLDEAGDPVPKKKTGRVFREEMLADAQDMSGINGVFLAMVVLSALVAAVGLSKNNAAVIIGAMVIAPLLGPNVALSLATTLGDFALAGKSLGTLAVGVIIALLLSFLIGRLVMVDATSLEIASRTSVGFGDLVLALASGAAGAIAFSQAVSASLIGVMVAVALLPPLITAGLLFGNEQVALGWGAMLLFGTNVICVNLSGVATFLIQGIRPNKLWEADQARKATFLAVLTWTLLLLVLVLFLLYSPPGGGGVSG